MWNSVTDMEEGYKTTSHGDWKRLPGRAALATGRYEAYGDNEGTATAPASFPLAWTPMGNTVNLRLNPRYSKRRKVLKRRAKWQAARGWRSDIATPSLVAQPGDSRSLKGLLKVARLELGKPDGPHQRRTAQYQSGGIPPAMAGEGPAGVECRSKRRPGCNGSDRAARGRKGTARGDTQPERAQTSGRFRLEGR